MADQETPETPTTEASPTLPMPIAEMTEVPGAEIQQLIWERLMPALDGLPIPHAVLAMLSFCVIILKPNATPDELGFTVEEASKMIITSLAPVKEGSVN